MPGAAPVAPPPAGYPPGTVVVYEPAPPPPPPADDGTWRNHDGFYLRMGIGAGYGRVKSTGEFQTGLEGASTDMEIVYSGAGPAYELLIGGTPGGGVVVGGGFVGQDISDPKVEVDGEELDADLFDDDDALGMVLLGPFVDWFPDPRGGAHVGAMIGVAAIGLSDGGDEDDNESSTGWGGSLWGGYDFWVANQWSLGAEGRVAYLSTHRDFGGSSAVNAEADDRGLTFEVLFTALYH